MAIQGITIKDLEEQIFLVERLKELRNNGNLEEIEYNALLCALYIAATAWPSVMPKLNREILAQITGVEQDELFS